MSRGVNKVILIGNLGNEPDVRYMPSGDAVANVSIATSEAWKDKNTGEMQERTEWHRVVFFGKIAEVVKQYLHKGSKIYVEGQAAHAQVAGAGRAGPLHHGGYVVESAGPCRCSMGAPAGVQQSMATAAARRGRAAAVGSGKGLRAAVRVPPSSRPSTTTSRSRETQCERYWSPAGPASSAVISYIF